MHRICTAIAARLSFPIYGILEERPRDGVELAGLDEFIGFAYGGNYPLVNGLTFPLVFHDLEVRVAAGFL